MKLGTLKKTTAAGVALCMAGCATAPGQNNGGRKSAPACWLRMPKKAASTAIPERALTNFWNAYFQRSNAVVEEIGQPALLNNITKGR